MEVVMDRISGLINNFIKEPWQCAVFVCVIGFFILATVRSIAGGLYEMHRSKSAIKKLNKSYSFHQKLFLRHVWEKCLHAQKFSWLLIFCYYVRSACLLVSVLLTALAYIYAATAAVNAYFTVAINVLLDFPVVILHLVLEKHPFRRFRHEYRFEKYNNTSERNRLL